MSLVADYILAQQKKGVNKVVNESSFVSVSLTTISSY